MKIEIRIKLYADVFSNLKRVWILYMQYEKDVNLLNKCLKNQEASYNFRLGFALSNRPHLHRAYLVTVLM